MQDRARAKETDDYQASNMKFDEQEHEQLMGEATNMDRVLKGEQVITICPPAADYTMITNLRALMATPAA